MGKEVKFTTKLPVAKLELNEGQLEGLPTNPRYIKDEKFAKLKLSLERSPEFLEANPLKVYIIIGGNMRFLAGKEIGIKEFPCYIFAKETTTEKLKEFLIKDNVAYGSTDWDSLANNDWNVDDLDEWGMDVSFLDGGDFVLEAGTLDGLQEGGFQNQVREETNSFQMSFVFPLDKKDDIDNFIKKQGKGYIVNRIVEMCCEDSEKDEGTEGLDKDIVN